MSEKENNTKRYLLDIAKRYLLDIADSTEENNCRWKLSLTEEDIDKAKYIREITEESDKRFGTYNRLRLYLDLTNSFKPENRDTYGGLELNESKLIYVGNGKFIVNCDISTLYREYGILVTEEFKIDL